MPAIVTNDLQRVLDVRDPQQVDIVLEAEPGEGDAVDDLFTDLGIEVTSVQAGDKEVFEGTVNQSELQTLQESEYVAVIDYSPTFLPTGMSPSAVPGRSEAQTPGEVNRADLKGVTDALGFPETWEETGVRGEEVKVGIVDTEIDDNHPALQSSVAGKGTDFAPSTHGTWVASAIVGDETETPRGTIRGGAPDAELYSYGALSGGGATTSEIAAGVGYLLEQDVDVINMSLGGPHSSILHSIIQEADRKGALVISSAGNSGPGSRTVTCPAHHKETVAVGSISTDGDPASFSSRGPGQYEARQKPDVVSFGGSASLDNGDIRITETILGADAGGGGAYLVGTSMASPEVTAMAALRVSNRRVNG